MRIDRIKLAIELTKQDMTSVELARRTGLSRPTISSIKTGRSCTPATALKIAAALNVPLDHLIEQRGE